MSGSTCSFDSMTGGKEHARKRVARACDRCRLKKGKCDGRDQCAKCLSADVMCIYTDRKPPQHKSISPVMAEALQSENLTLKKAAVILFKALVRERNGQLPIIEGVEWDSDKVTNGKSGRALNFIITEEAKVDNHISNEEIISYDSDTNMLEASAKLQRAESPSSQYSHSPQSNAADMPSWMYNEPGSAGLQHSQHQDELEFEESTRLKKRKSAGYSYSPSIDSNSNGMTASDLNLEAVHFVPQRHDHAHKQQSTPFIDPNLLQPAATFTHPSSPRTTMESVEYLRPSPVMGDMQMQWGMDNQQQQMMFGPNPMLMSQQYHAADIQQGRMMIPVSSPSGSEIATTSAPPPGDAHSWGNMPSQFYPTFMASSDVEKEEMRRVFEAMNASLQDSQMLI